MLDCIIASTASGNSVRISKRIGLHPLNEPHADEALVDIPLQHKFRHGGNHVFVRALDVKHVVCTGGDDLLELSQLRAAFVQHGKMQQVLNEDCALFQLDILARNEDHLIAQLRCVLDGVDAFKLH